MSRSNRIQESCKLRERWVDLRTAKRDLDTCILNQGGILFEVRLEKYAGVEIGKPPLRSSV